MQIAEFRLEMSAGLQLFDLTWQSIYTSGVRTSKVNDSRLHFNVITCCVM